MSKQKIFIHVMGARPNFIKAAPIIKYLNNKNITNKILHTGQHYDYDLSEQFFKELQLPKPFVNLNIGSLSHGKQTGRMVEGIEEVLLKNKCDFVIIYGDTNSTLAGAIAASKLNIPIAHIEAGLRTPSKISPEEKNRRVCDHLSTINFSPTMTAYKNLLNEGLSGNANIFSGDVMYDTVLNTNFNLNVDFPNKFILATIHRQENTDDPIILKSIFNILMDINKTYPIIMPIHPRTKNKLLKIGLYDQIVKSINIIQPQSYKSLLSIIKQADLVISDSGGVPKEAAFLGTKSIVIRDDIIWDELLKQKWAVLITPDNIKNIKKIYLQHINSKLPEKIEGFGNGKAAIEIVDNILKFNEHTK